MVAQHGDEHEIPDEHKIHRYVDIQIPNVHHTYSVRPGAWLPPDHRIHKAGLGGVIDHVDNNPKELQPVLKEFKTFIEGNTRVRMYFESMFEEIPNKKPYSKDPTGHKQMRDYHHMLEILNHILTTAPAWSDAAENVGMVGVPMNAIFDWPIGTARYVSGVRLVDGASRCQR